MTVTHLDRVRDEYHRTKADHAQPHGCNNCATGFVEGRSTGWDYEPDGTPTLCPPCAAETKRYAAQMAGVAERTVCRNGLHDMTIEANRYPAANGNGKVVIRCRPCYWKAGAEAKRRARARDKAAGL
jgi:hypothetical protein